MAMGLMAVLALLLVIMVARLKSAAEVAKTREETAIAMSREALRTIQGIVETARLAAERQRRVMTLLARTFEEAEGCELRLDPVTGNLVPVGVSAGSNSDFFFAPGDDELNPKAAQAVKRCGEAFRAIGVCLGPLPSRLLNFWRLMHDPAWLESDVEDPDCNAPRGSSWMPRARAYAAACLNLERKGDASAPTATWAEVGAGVEALLLEGHTDRSPRHVTKGQPVSVEGARWDKAATTGSWNFLKNAHLGAERARSAMAHVLNTVAGDRSAELCSVESVLHARLQVVSPSFGRFMAGPMHTTGFREFDAGSDRAACPAGTNSAEEPADCANARTLRLRIRWRDDALQEPLLDLTSEICHQLDDTSSDLRRLIVLIEGKHPGAFKEIRVRAGCPEAEAEHRPLRART